MNRLGFIRLGLIGISTGILAPKLALAGPKDDPKAGGVYYTSTAAGRWADKVGGHLPKITVEKMGGTDLKVKVVTTHPMDGYKHYIVKHQLLDKNFKFIAEKRFDPTQDDEPVSEFTLQNYRGSLYAISMCNIHDLWLNSVQV